MNKTLKIFGILAVLAMPAWADDVAVDESRTLGARTDCTAIAAEINTITKTEDPDEEMLSRLEELQIIQRRDCSKNTARRRAMGRGGKMAAVVEAAMATPEEIEEVIIPESDSQAVDSEVVETESEAVVSDGVSGMECDALESKINELNVDAAANADALEIYTSEFDARCTVASKSPDEISELIASGLCADGSKPNKFGCCGDEKFKDLGNGAFGCCPPGENSDCFPPITTGSI